MVGRSLASSSATSAEASPHPPKRKFPGVMTRSVTSKDHVVSLVRSIARKVRASTNAKVNAAPCRLVGLGIRSKGQTCSMIDPRFVYVAVALSLVGGYGYIRATLRGDTAPN